jgi:hypothetical protein
MRSRGAPPDASLSRRLAKFSLLLARFARSVLQRPEHRRCWIPLSELTTLVEAAGMGVGGGGDGAGQLGQWRWVGEAFGAQRAQWGALLEISLAGRHAHQRSGLLCAVNQAPRI